MKKILCILLSLLLVLLNGCSGDTGNIRFGAAGVGGMYYTFANSFTGILSKENENYSYEVKNTAGSTANIRLLSNHYIDLAIAQADLIQDAYEEPVHLMVTSVKTTVPLPVSIQKPARLLSVQTHPFIHSMICRENISVSVPRNPAQSEMQKKFLQRQD